MPFKAYSILAEELDLKEGRVAEELVSSDCGTGEDSELLRLQEGDQTCQS